MPGSPVTQDTRAIDLWTLPEQRVAELASRMGGAALLGSGERERYDRLRRPASRRRFLGGRLLSRLALSSRAELPPDTWQFALTRSGRPEPRPDHGLRFNLSHTDGLIVCVVTQGRACGVDVERVPFDPDKTRFVSAYFDTADRSGPYRSATPDLDPTERWVLTEAYLKGLGVGLADGPAGVHFRRTGAGRFTVTDHRRPAAATRWRLQLLRPYPHHLIAVATEGDGTLRHRHPARGRQTTPPTPSLSRKEDLPCPSTPR